MIEKKITPLWNMFTIKVGFSYDGPLYDLSRPSIDGRFCLACSMPSTYECPYYIRAGGQKIDFSSRLFYFSEGLEHYGFF